MSKIFKAFNDVYEPPKPSDSPLQVSVELLKKLGYSEEGKLILPFKELFPERKEVSIGEILVSEMDCNKERFFNLVSDLLIHYEDASAKDIFYGVDIFDRGHEGKIKKPWWASQDKDFVCDKPEYFYEIETSLSSITMKGFNTSLIHVGVANDTIVDAKGARLMKKLGGYVTLTPNAKDCICMVGQSTRVVGHGGTNNIYYLVDGLVKATLEDGLIISEALSSNITTTGISPIVISDGKDSTIIMNGMMGTVFSYGNHTSVSGRADLNLLALKGKYNTAFLNTLPNYFYLGESCTLSIHDIASNMIKEIRSGKDVKTNTWYQAIDKESNTFEEVKEMDNAAL